MRNIGLFEAKTHLSEIIRSGEEVCLTNRGEEVAVITPIAKYRKQNASDAFARFEKLKKSRPLGDKDFIISAKGEGRK